MNGNQVKAKLRRDFPHITFYSVRRNPHWHQYKWNISLSGGLDEEERLRQWFRNGMRHNRLMPIRAKIDILDYNDV